ncbi:IS1634 family transposase [Patescibacteria group bacterium]|nr:IS1634 family transposase [Patescibacteria group bacterium]
MFVRKKRNKSGSVSVQVIDKTNGYKVFKTIGSATDPDEIEELVLEAKQFLRFPKGQLKLISLKSRDALVIETFTKNLSNAQIHTLGPELVFGVLFDRIGFNKIPDELFRHLVVARLAYPVSKLKTVDYLYRYRGIQTSKDSIYRFLDDLNNKYKKRGEDISYQYTKKTLGSISVVFYDMTTLYFEAEDEDDLRKIGFSKDGKFQKPQIMLGLLVGERGLPIGYNIFKGNTFEGHTLMPVIKDIQTRYGFNKPVVVADAGLLSKDNLNNLSKQEYKFIIGARIKNESRETKQKILEQSRGMKDGDGFSIKKVDGTRLVVTYSDKRARKDAHNRRRGLAKLRKRVKSGRLTKSSINNRGYNKFLTLTGEIKVTVDEERIKQDEGWDGLKGYVTNTRLSAKTVTQNYSHLWQIEKAFRISKTDLRIRPIYHRRHDRIEAHICVSFVAYTIYKELERLLTKYKIPFSPKRAAELTHNMYQLEYQLPGEEVKTKTLLKMDEEQKLLYDVIHNRA